MTRIAAALALATATLAGAPGAALAHGPDAIFDPLTMDQLTPVTTLAIDFSYIKYDEPANTDYTVMGFAVGGQYVSPLGLGGYLKLPLSYLAVDTILGDDSELAVGNLELGGLYTKYVTDHSAVVLHAGVALPTAGDELVLAPQTLASSPRFGDFVQRVTNSTWLRLGVSPMGRSGKLFWRADIGFDLALEEENNTKYSPVFRVNVGGGLDLRSVHLLVEFVTNVVDDDSNDEVGSTIAFGARFLSGNLRPGIALILPVDIEGVIVDPEFAITASIAARL